MSLNWKRVLVVWMYPKTKLGARIATVIALALGITLITLATRGIYLNGWPRWGIGERESISTTIEKDAKGNITKTVETITPKPEKTVWDWLNLLGVPLVLALLGFWFQRRQQQQAQAQAKVQRQRDQDLAEEQQKREEAISTRQREMAADANREEALQIYLDRLSTLLVDKSILAIATKIHGPEEEAVATPEQQALYEAAVDIIRARTLSILKRFEADVERKNSILCFLIEAEILSKTNLSLRGANLCNADLSRTNLNGADLSHADLSSADLSGAKLCGANLSGANLSGANLNLADLSLADLSYTNLSNAKFFYTDISNTSLKGADLMKAIFIDTDLSVAILTNADLRGIRLCRTKLPNKSILDPNQDCEALGIAPDTGYYIGI